MSAFDVGSLVFTIKAAGAQVFQQELRQADQAMAGAGKSADATSKQVDKLGESSNATGKKARSAKQPLDEQANSTRKVGDESRTAKPKQDEQAKATERQAQSARTLSVALLAAGVAVTALVGLSVAKFASFDQAMSNTAAATMATAAEQKVLGDAALEAGADTAYSANEAAAAQEELAKAGLSVSNIVGGSLNASLALAAAGELEVARSATIMATTLKQFKLPAEDAAHVADLLAAGAGKAQGSVDDLALGLQYVGPIAAGMGFSLENTVGILAELAEQGQLGERAGTGLRGVLMSLSAPSALAAKEMEKYGISIYDANEQTVAAPVIMERMRKALSGLSDAERDAALGRIFGNESMTVARILYEGGAKAVNEWTDAVDDSGFAADQAARRQDNLAGDVEKLGGAFDTALIKTGSGANDVLRDMVQTVTFLVDGFGELDPTVQQGALSIGGMSAAGVIFAGVALSMIGRFAELKKVLEGTNMTMGKTALIAGGVGIALAGVLTVVGMLASQQAAAEQKAKSYSDTLEEGAAKVTKATRDMVVENLQAKQSLNLLGLEVDAITFDSAADAAEKLGIDMGDLTDAAMGNVDALERVAEVTKLRNRTDEEAIAVRERLGLKEGEFADAIDSVINGVDGENASLDEAIRLAKQKNEVTEEGVPITETAAEAYLGAADGVAELNTQLDELIDKIMEANGIGQDAVTANLNYKNTLADVDEVVRKATEGLDENEDGIADYILTLDEVTQAGRDNKAMLVGLAEDSQKAAKAQFDLDSDTAAYRKTLEDGHQALVDRATALGLDADAAGLLADQIYRIPSDTEWEVIADTAAAQEALDTFVGRNQGRTISMFVATNGNDVTFDDVFTKKADGGIVEFFAGGGVRENHVAQIARAGDFRVWAEPETEGEAYIPLAQSKRARSEEILQDVAGRFGYALVPAAARGYASGGVPAAPSQQGATKVVIGTRGGIDLLDYIDVKVEAPMAAMESALRSAG